MSDLIQHSRIKHLFGFQNGQDRNPYLDARRAWNSQIDRAFSSLHTWQLIGVTGLLIALGSIGGIIYIGSKAKFVPYVIEVDKLGTAVVVGPAVSASQADSRVVMACIGSFISNARLVTPDQDVQRKAVFAVYAMLHSKDPAITKMTEYFDADGENSPFKRAEKITVNTDISTVLPITAKTWQVDWTETTRDRAGGGLIGKPANMRATLEIYIEPAGTDARMADLEKNPLGIYVRDFNWQQR
jgi:type IV secretion system protein TrbF